MASNVPTFGGKPLDQEAAMRKTIAAVTQLHNAGKFDEALKLLEAEPRVRKSATGHNVAGNILLKLGKHREALRAFDAAAKLAPTAPEPLANRGVALQEMGRLDEALASEDRAIKLRAEYATAHFNRGNILKALKRLDEAVAAFGRALKAQPTLAEAQLNRGMALIGLGRPMEGLADFGRALTLRPTYAEAHLGRAAANRDLGRMDDAFAAIDAAMAIDPGNLEAAHLRCAILFSAERYAESVVAADALIAREPDDEVAHAARAVALSKLQRYEEALASADAAIRIAPQFDEAHTARGIVLGEMGRLAESLAALDAARRLGASTKDYFHARAVALSALGDPQEALAAYSKAIELNPESHMAHHNRAFLRLSLGDWKEGWEDHSWRLKAPSHPHAKHAHLAPTWQGEDLRGKRLFAYTEQGFGDTIQFVRYLRLLEGKGAAITLEVPEAIRRLFAANFPDVDVTDLIGTRRGFDYQVSLMSLPRVFGSTLETMPREVPYLTAEPDRVEKWRERIGGDGFKVGIVWQGNPKYGRDRDRSIRLAEFAPLAEVPGVRLISLQSAAGAHQLKMLPEGMKVEDLGEEVVNNPDGFREVAAVMASLDLLIMSDTGPTHLAGALGRPVWVALGRHPDWRWMRERTDTPWYPTMRLFRQETAGDWPGVFRRLAAELRAAVERQD